MSRGAILRGALLAGCASACTAWAQPATRPTAVSVAAFNMAWAGTPEDFEQHLAVCRAAAVNWCDTRARWMPGTMQASPEETARAEACQAATAQAAGGRERANLIAPCNAYASAAARRPGAPAAVVEASRRPQAYLEKLEGLRDTVDALIEREQVRVIAFQEVKSAEAVRAVLGRHADRFEVCAAAHNGFQSLAFAWDRALSEGPGTCTPNPALAVLDPPQDPAAFRRVRPGLALQLKINGAPVTFMNVHLKSGCASATQSNPRFPARLMTDAVEPCEVLNRQVPILEDWIDAVAARSPRWVMLGDFNRRIDEEATLAIAKDQVRSDGSDPAGRHVVQAGGRSTTRYLWPELADGSRSVFRLPLTATDPACRGFVGLDHVVISGPVQAAMLGASAASIGARKAPVIARPGQAIGTSDHCPLVAQLML